MKRLLRLLFIFSAVCIVFSVSLMSQETFSYDTGAQVNRAINGTDMGKYRVYFNMTYTIAYFRDRDRPAVNFATYNCEKQYWEWKHADFDTTGIDLQSLFSSVNLSKTTLDRTKPESETISRDAALENRPYDYRNDRDFANFIAYCDRLKVPADTRQFYIMAANNAAKRGTLILDTGKTLTDNDVGIQWEAFKPKEYKNKPVPLDKRDGITKIAGGMQLYFEYGKRVMFRYVDEAQNIFKDNVVVPVTIVELEPKEGNTGPAVLRGNALVKMVRANLESAFHKKFRVRLMKMTISYTELGNYGTLPLLTYFDQFMAKNVNPKVGKNTLIIYYMTDSKRLYAIDDDKTHPLLYGPYGSDWGKMGFSIIHEMGHTLGMRHHFSDRDGSADIKAHISPSCIMNYRYNSKEFCPLCRYGLGVNK